MPRSDLDVFVRLERLQVLDEDSGVDDDLVPELDDDELRRMYRIMVLSRRFDERRLELQKQHRIGTFAPAIGQEASQVGAASALRDDDWVVPSYRESCVMLWRGLEPATLLVYDAGYNEGAAVPEGGRDLPISVPVASQIPHAAGLGYAARLAGTDEVVAVFFGDGATSEGDFHEALNFAAVHASPVLFVCQNNQYAISTPIEEQMASSTIAQKAAAYGVAGLQVDGNDVLGVRVAAEEAARRARDGDGPTLIECVTYRMSVHTTADDPSAYRTEEEEERWRRRDPLTRFAEHLRSRGILDDEARKALEDDVDETVAGVWEEAERRIGELGGPDVMFEHLYAEPPAYLDGQHHELAGRAEGRDGDG